MPSIKDSSKNPIPLLTMIGKILRFITLMLTVDIVFAEKRVMPLTMVLASAVCFGVAASFYFQNMYNSIGVCRSLRRKMFAHDIEKQKNYESEA